MSQIKNPKKGILNVNIKTNFNYAKSNCKKT